jgi:hypothetical protein
MWGGILFEPPSFFELFFPRPYFLPTPYQLGDFALPKCRLAMGSLCKAILHPFPHSRIPNPPPIILLKSSSSGERMNRLHTSSIIVNKLFPVPKNSD